MNHEALTGYGKGVVKRDKITVHMATCSDPKCGSDFHVCPKCLGPVTKVTRTPTGKGVIINYWHSETEACADQRPLDKRN